MMEGMKTWRACIGLVGCLALVACDDSPDESESPPGVERITGNERIGWNQPAASAAGFDRIRYAVYVDGARSELAGVSCDGSPGPSGYSCSSALPPLALGLHTLELAAFVLDGASILESARSAPIRVELVSTAATASVADWQTGVPVLTADGLQLRLDLVATGLRDPVDLAVAPDGRIFVAERSGRVRIIDIGGGRRVGAGLQVDVPPEPESGEVLAIALDPEFAETSRVFLIETEPAPRGAMLFRLVRYRAVGGRLGERAVLLDGIDAAPGRPSASLRFGPDGLMYAAFDDAGDVRLGGDLASFNGKLLRLDADGSTPDDQAAGSPVYASWFQSPRGFDWRPEDGTVWLADTTPDGGERLSVVAETGRDPVRTTVAMRYTLPRLTGASAVTFYRGALIAGFAGDLLVAGDEGRHLLRLRFAADGSSRLIASERLLQDRVGPIRAVAVGPLGEIYFCTPDAVGRLAPG